MEKFEIIENAEILERLELIDALHTLTEEELSIVDSILLSFED